jgi:hypothetical protein
MEHETLTSIAGRMALLERRLRRERRVWLGIGLGVLVTVGIAAQTPPPAPTAIRATRLEVVDEAGQVVFTVSAARGGSTLLVQNSAGQPGVGVYASETGGRLAVLNAEGQEVFSAGVRQDTGLAGLWERNCKPSRSNGERLTSSARNSSRSAGSFVTFHSQAAAVGRQSRSAVS